jgi:hypothetical protein
MTVDRRMRLRTHHQSEPVLVAPPLSSATAYPFDAAPFWWLWNGHQWHGADPTRLRRRAVTVGVVAWLPLVLLTVQQHGVGSVDAWFTALLDVRIIARYLIAIPVLMVGEPAYIGRLSGIVRHFQRAAFVRRADTTRFARILATSRSMLANHFVELVIVLLAYAVSLHVLLPVFAGGGAAWQLQGVAENPRLSEHAQWWLIFVSQPLFLIFVARWCWRSVVWHRTLRCIARLDLNLVPAHPDRSGGLLFVAQSVPALAPFGFALGAALAGAMAGSTSARMLDLATLAGAVGVLLATLLTIAVGPLCWLWRPLRAAKLRGIVEYGELAVRIGRRFEARWLRERRFVTSDALSSSDFSATIDLYSVVTGVYTLRLVPVKLRSVLKLVLATVIPFFPVLLSIVPAKDVLHVAAKLFL